MAGLAGGRCGAVHKVAEACRLAVEQFGVAHTSSSARRKGEAALATHAPQPARSFVCGQATRAGEAHGGEGNRCGGAVHKVAVGCSEWRLKLSAPCTPLRVYDGGVKRRLARMF